MGSASISDTINTDQANYVDTNDYIKILVHSTNPSVTAQVATLDVDYVTLETAMDATPPTVPDPTDE